MLCGGKRMVTLPILYVFFSSCPTNLSSTEATTRSHSERVAYACLPIFGGRCCWRPCCAILPSYLVRLWYVQSVFYHELSLIRSPFSSGSHYRLKLVAGLLLVYGTYYYDESPMTSCGLELHVLTSTEIAVSERLRGVMYEWTIVKVRCYLESDITQFGIAWYYVCLR